MLHHEVQLQESLEGRMIAEEQVSMAGRDKLVCGRVLQCLLCTCLLACGQPAVPTLLLLRLNLALPCPTCLI